MTTPSQPEPHITRDDLEEWGFRPTTQKMGDHFVQEMDPRHWGPYQKRYATFARKMDGPFHVFIDGQWVRTEDGYLAIDARGFPYPIDALEFSLNYQPIEGEPHGSSEEDSSEEDG